MNQTEHYQLNQWAPEDRILREDFNRDNTNIENGLFTLKQGLETETQNRTAAVTAAREEASEAVSAARQEASQALTAAAGLLENGKADKTALAQVQAQVDAIPFVKLQEITVSPGGVNQVDVDVSQMQWEKYAYVLFRVKLWLTKEASIKMLVNNITDITYYAINGSAIKYLQMFKGMTTLNYTYDAVQIQFMEDRNGGLTTLKTAVSGYDGRCDIAGGRLNSSEILAPQVQTLNFVAENGAAFSEGGKIYIYGVKL